MWIRSGLRVPSGVLSVFSTLSVPLSGACPSPGHWGFCPSVPAGTVIFLSLIVLGWSARMFSIDSRNFFLRAAPISVGVVKPQHLNVGGQFCQVHCVALPAVVGPRGYGRSETDLCPRTVARLVILKKLSNRRGRIYSGSVARVPNGLHLFPFFVRWTKPNNVSAHSHSVYSPVNVARSASASFTFAGAALAALRNS